MILATESGICVSILPLSVVTVIGNPFLKSLHFRTPIADRYLLAVWRKDNQNSLIQLILQPLAEDLVHNDFMKLGSEQARGKLLSKPIEPAQRQKNDIQKPDRVRSYGGGGA